MLLCCGSKHASGFHHIRKKPRVFTLNMGCAEPASPSRFPYFLSSHGPSFCPSNTLSLFVPKGLCTGCLHCLDHSASNICLAAQVIQASTQTLPPCSFICLLIYCLSCSIPPKHPLECRSHEGRGVAQHVAWHTVGISVRWRINALIPALRAALIVS